MNNRWDITSLDSRTIRDIRHSFAEQLARCGKTEAQIRDCTIILGELLANACEHGSLPIRVELCPCGEHWQLRVSDAGAGFAPVVRPAEPLDVRGRGLSIVESLGGTIHVSEGRSPSVDVTLPLRD